MDKNPVIDSDGNKHWYNKNGDYHRIGGPAIIYKDGSKFWYKNGQRHRTDGPAQIWKDGRVDEEGKEGCGYWFINGRQIKPIPQFIIKWSKKLKEKEEYNYVTLI